MRRVVVTGMGVLAPGGLGVQRFFNAITSGTSAITRINTPLAEELNTRYAGQVHMACTEHFSSQQLRTMDKVSQFALIAAREAIADAQLPADVPSRLKTGVYLGTAVGGATTLDDGYVTLYTDRCNRLKPFTVLMVMNNAAAAWIAQEHRFEGPTFTYSTACSSSAVAIGEAAQRIRLGQADVMLAGGAEAPLTFGQIKAWESLRTLAIEDQEDPTASCKPFARNRSGFVLGEGAGIVILEAAEHAENRGARIYAELVGYGTTTDSQHMTRPSLAGQVRAIQTALADAAMEAKTIDYINAHGTGTVQNDAVETAAIKEVFADLAYEIPVSSTKAAHGHLLGAAGVVEFIACIKAMHDGILPPTLHLHEPDPACDLDYVANIARTATPFTIMTNSFAFGGTNAVLIARRTC